MTIFARPTHDAAPTPGLRSPRIERVTYTALRVAFGAVLFTHGWPKATGSAHGSMADPMAGSTRLIDEVLGLPMAPLLAWLVMLLETAGAAMLAAGVATRLVAALVVVEMLAICVAPGPTWPWIDRGIEYPALMAALAGYITVRGTGGHSLLPARWQRTAWLV